MAAASTLDSFLNLPQRPPPQIIATSQEILDRGSVFIANAFRAGSPAMAKTAINHLKHVVHGARPASHEITAWRCMVLKSGRTGLDGPEDFELRTGANDDGEQWASSKVLKVMEDEGVIDAVVIVSRWYGGTLLGPARFTHIQTCAAEVCRILKRRHELEDCISLLTSLDDILAELRADFAKLSTKDPPTVPNTKLNYSTSTDEANITKLKRLIAARENAIKSVKVLLAKKRAELPAETS